MRLISQSALECGDAFIATTNCTHVFTTLYVYSLICKEIVNIARKDVRRRGNDYFNNSMKFLSQKKDSVVYVS